LKTEKLIYKLTITIKLTTNNYQGYLLKKLLVTLLVNKLEIYKKVATGKLTGHKYLQLTNLLLFAYLYPIIRNLNFCQYFILFSILNFISNYIETTSLISQ
jgi:hypothetical protein